MPFSIDLPARTFRHGSTVAFRGDNGLFLSRIDELYLEFRKELVDKFCIFTIVEPENHWNSMAIRGDNGMYMSYVYKDVEQHFVWLAKSTIDEFCLFKPVVQHDRGMVALQASNGKHVSRINQHDVRASKDLLDRFCFLDLVSDPHAEGGRYA